MADANWDRIEYAGASYAKEKGETYIFTWRLMDLGMRENMMREVGVSTNEAGSDWEQLPYEITEPLKLKMNDLFRETGRESRASEAFDTDWACPRCGNKNVKIKYDEDGNPSGRECPKCGLGKESYANEVSYYSIKNSPVETVFENKFSGDLAIRDDVLRKLERSASHKEDVWEQEESMQFDAELMWKRWLCKRRASKFRYIFL